MKTPVFRVLADICYFLFFLIIIFIIVTVVAITATLSSSRAFPSDSYGKESACSAGDLVQSLDWEDPRRRKWQLTPVLLPGKFHVQRSLAGYSPWGRKESDMTEQLLFKYLTVVLTYISLIPNDVELFFPCLLAISLSSLEKYILKSFVYF